MNTRLQSIITFLNRQKTIGWLYLIAAVVASVHLILLGKKSFNGLDIYTSYNNFVIFRNAWFHLIDYKDLYVLWPFEQYDLYKYSPAFALAMFPFAMVPAWLGLILWNMLNAALLFYACSKFPFANLKVKVFAMWFLLQETLTGLQSAQTNPMIAALILLAFIAFEQKKVIWASLFIVLTVFIKVFGVVAFVLWLLYPQKGKFILYTIGWTVLLLLCPLVVVSPDQLIFLYRSWLNLLQNDHAVSYGLSVMGWLKSWFGLEPQKFLVVIIGALLLLLPYVKVNAYKDLTFRIFSLSALLIWVIIFNHKAESSTFVIAVTGIALWYYNQTTSVYMTALVVFAFVFTCLSPTDLFPRSWRIHFVEPYVMKAFPCILIWMVMQWQLLTGRYLQKN